MNTEAEYVQTGEAARILQLGPDMVRYLERTGRLPAAIKTERGLRLFLRRDVELLARQREARSHNAER